MGARNRRSQRATLLAFGLVALAAFSSVAQEPSTETSVSVATPRSVNTPLPGTGESEQKPLQAEAEVDRAAEATRAYRQALNTLATLTAQSPSHTREASFNPYGSHPHSNTNPLLSSILPNLQGHGPIASAVRIVQRLRQRSWLPHVITSRLGLGGREKGSSGWRREEELKGKAIKVVDLLQHSAELGNAEALYTLAKLSLLPPTAHFAADPMLAYESFRDHASLTGNASSQAYLGFFHATGYHDVVPVDQGKAQLFYTFAAHGGDKGAQMTLGYRYWSGIGTAQDCARAADWYEMAAEQVMAKFLSGPPGGRTLPLTATRLSDLSGGIYGPGASVASTGMNAMRPAIKAADARAAGETWEDILEYYRFTADRGDMEYALRLGKIYYQGSIYATAGGIASGAEGVGAIPRDYGLAYRYFLAVARQLWPKDPTENPLQHAKYAPVVKDEDRPGSGWAVSATAFLGRMHMRGEGVRQNAALARMWFERGAEYGNRECYNGLGIIWRDGLVDGKKDVKKAVGYFAVAAGQDLAEAQVNLGKYHYQRGDVKMATMYFDAAVRHGSPFEAFYYLADLHHRLTKTPGAANTAAGSCAMAVSFYKLVVERGAWAGDLLREAEAAWAAESARGREAAMLLWWIAAERGHEIAQNNLAFVLDQDKSVLRLTRFAPITPSNDTARVALMQWTRSSAQHNVDALVKVGDYYYHGLGVPDEPEGARWEKAAGYYLSAAETHMSALAMWNMGWMYENGLGVPQDFHLAKRYYDLALDTNSEAYLPVMLSLVKLYARSFWHTLKGGKEGLSLWHNDDDEVYGVDEQEPREIEGSTKQPDTGAQSQSDEPYHAEPEDDGPWYFGKAREQFDRRRREQDLREEEDPIQFARDRRAAEAERDSDFGPEDYFDAALRGAHRADGGGGGGADELSETVLLVALCLAVSALLVVRGRLQERMRRREQLLRERDEALAALRGRAPPMAGQGQGQGQPAPPAQGVFPGPDDPAREDWAVMR